MDTAEATTTLTSLVDTAESLFRSNPFACLMAVAVVIVMRLRRKEPSLDKDGQGK